MPGCTSLIPLEYRGQHPELFTVAIHSLLGVRGYHSHFDASIKIVEEDKYGRTLFFYDEFNATPPYYLLIAQKTDATYAYYYPNFHFISRDLDTSFAEQVIQELKDKNDWNKPLNKNELIFQRIVRKKTGYRLNEKDRENIFRKAIGYNGDTRISRSDIHLTTDKYGKRLFYSQGVTPDHNSGRIYLAIIINADDSYDLETCFMKITDRFNNYQHDLKAFKELNNWSEPWAIPRQVLAKEQ